MRLPVRARAPSLLVLSLGVACERADPRPAAPPVDTMLRSEPPAGPAPDARRRLVTADSRFEDYGVADTALGRPRAASPDLATAAYGRLYRTKLREGAAGGPNFARRYTIVLWGCGTGCQIVSVVDARTGRLSRETLLAANGVRVRRDSRLIVADPPAPEHPPQCSSCGTPAYYKWRNGAFAPVGPGLHPHLGGPRPWRAACAPGDTGAAARGGYTCPGGGRERRRRS